MTKVILGNHTAVFAARADQERIRSFYCGVLGCEVGVQSDEVDRLQLGDAHFCFVWQDAALAEGDFLRALYLELASDDPETMRRKIVDFGVNTLEVPDPHLYFQAPGGQVFRLVEIGEDLSLYEGSASARPVSAASA